MRAIAIAAVMLAACDGGAAVGDDGTPCPDVELAGGWFPVGEQPGVYVVEIVQGETHLTAGFTIAAPEPTPAMPRDVRAFVAPGSPSPSSSSTSGCPHNRTGRRRRPSTDTTSKPGRT